MLYTKKNRLCRSHTHPLWAFLSMENLVIIASVTIYIILNIHHVLINDILWLSQIGEQWLHGGQYFKDYYETNPPLAFYIYLPTYIFRHYLRLSETQAFILYFALIFSFVLFLTNDLLLQYKQAKRFRILTLLVLCFGFLYLPHHQVGQRDLFSSILVINHVLYACLRLKEPSKLHPFKHGSILFLASIGYMVKPHFIGVWGCLFIGLMCKSKNFKKCVKITDSFIFLIALLIYLIIVALFNLEYLTIALPLLLKTYYASLGTNRLYLIGVDLQGSFKLWAIAISCLSVYYVKYKNMPLLYLAYAILATGYMLTNLGQGLGFAYHALPSAIFAFLLGLLVIAENIYQYRPFAPFTCLLIYAISMTMQEMQLANTDYVNKMMKLQRIFKQLPKQSRVAILLCNNGSGLSAIKASDMILASNFLTHYQICGSFLLNQPHVFHLLAQLMRQDLLKYKPQFLIRYKPNFKYHKIEQSLYNQLYDKPPSQTLWRSYQLTMMNKDYAVYQRFP